MWAGGRLRFLAPLKVGESATRESEILKVESKAGRSGALVFVTVRHRLSGAAGLALEEEHDIVYRPLPEPGAAAPAPPPAPTDGVWRREIRPDPVLLFRYSALTFNGHRIHYDQPYVTRVEGYPGLIVHGPLIATLLMDLANRERPGALRQFAFRAISPLFDAGPFSVHGALAPDGASARLWAAGPGGALAMSADAVLAGP
jgi:3-methylfumaryl-CoA hydratase